MITRYFVAYTGTAPAVADLTTFNNNISTAFSTDLASLFSDNGATLSTTTTDLSSSTSAEVTTSTVVSGTRVGVDTGAASCVVDSYTIARRYRGGHPRGYWPFGMIADRVNERTWVSTFVTACNTGFNAYFAAVLAGGWTGAGTLTHVNVSYYNGFLPVQNPITKRYRNVPTVRAVPVVDLVTGTRAQASIGTQRRRIQFVD